MDRAMLPQSAVESVIVRGVLKTVESKTTVSAPARASESSSACRSEPAPASLTPAILIGMRHRADQCSIAAARPGRCREPSGTETSRLGSPDLQNFPKFHLTSPIRTSVFACTLIHEAIMFAISGKLLDDKLF